MPIQTSYPLGTGALNPLPTLKYPSTQISILSNKSL